MNEQAGQARLRQEVADLARDVRRMQAGLELALRYVRALAAAQGLLPQIEQVDGEVGDWLAHASDDTSTEAEGDTT